MILMAPSGTTDMVVEKFHQPMVSLYLSLMNLNFKTTWYKYYLFFIAQELKEKSSYLEKKLWFHRGYMIYIY